MSDFLSPAKRNALMASLNDVNTHLENALQSEIHARGLRFRKHAHDLLGRPDIVFRAQRVVVFIDGDFWHGWRFPIWTDRLSPLWRAKIEGNRARDTRNFRVIRRAGWTVVRVWEHEVLRSPELAADRVQRALRRYA